jgi:hypothetical protein
MKKWMKLLLWICLFQVVGAGASVASADIIGIDNVHGLNAATILGSGGSFSTFRATITAGGHTLVPLSSFEAADLAGLEAAILMIPYNQNAANFTASQMSAIQSFTTRGVFSSDVSVWQNDGSGSERPISFGDNQKLLANIVSFITSAGKGALFIGDDGSGFNVANMNALVSPFGVSYSGTPTDGAGRTVTGFVPHAVTAGINTVGVDFQLPLTINSPSTDLTTGTGQDNILAVFESTTVVPEPSSFALAMTALTVLAGCLLRKRRNSRAIR